MIYSYTITTPKNTLEGDKQKTTLKLARGIIHRVEFVFPPGPAGLLHLHINDALHQRWPSNTGENFASDDENIGFHEHLELSREPLELQAYTWNLDDTYPHTVIIRIGLLKRQFVLRRLF